VLLWWVNSTSAVATTAAAKQSRRTLSLDIAEWSEEEGGPAAASVLSSSDVRERERLLV